ncbi:MAG: hypothetical protein LBQ12_03305 [Deltaproteobacteria bacterium]|nr:hypothetical protein [Deltaproteobacteria bacterium]
MAPRPKCPQVRKAVSAALGKGGDAVNVYFGRAARAGSQRGGAPREA